MNAAIDQAGHSRQELRSRIQADSAFALTPAGAQTLATIDVDTTAVAAATYVRASAPDAVALVFTCQAGVALSCLSTPISLGVTTDTVYVTLYAPEIRGVRNVRVFVAGQSVPVHYSGAQGQYQGLDQLNISLPGSLAGTSEASVYVVADGNTSNMTTINTR